MPSRIRHCVECSKCRIRYVIGLSPYDKGSYIVSNPPWGSRSAQALLLLR